MLHINNSSGYIVSDRIIANKDDIFYFERDVPQKYNGLIYGMSEAQAISNGAINLARVSGNFNAPRKEELPKSTFTEYALSLYFDFEQSTLNADAQTKIESWLAETNFSKVQSLLIEGYADEMGADDYNFSLSERRATTVANWLEKHGVNIQIAIKGKGKIVVDDKDATDENFANDDTSKYKQSIMLWNKKLWKNRKARRVDIKVII